MTHLGIGLASSIQSVGLLNTSIRRVASTAIVLIATSFLFSLNVTEVFAASINYKPIYQVYRPVQRPLFSEDGTVLWSGFRHSWKQTPHRLNQLGSAFKNIYFIDHEEDDFVGARHSARFRVGAVNDIGEVRTKGQFVKSSVLGFHHGSITSSCLEVEARVGDSVQAHCRKEIDLAAIDFDYDAVTVVLRGFEVLSTSYDKGYNTRGFMIRVIPGEQENGAYDFDALFKVHAEHSPDRPLLDDHCGSGDHCRYYSYHAKIYYTLIGVNHDDGHIEESGYNSYSQYVRMSPFKIPSLASSSERWTVIEGEPDFARALLGIQGFYWHLADWGRTRKDGRYIRELRFDLSSLDYDRDSGKARFKTNMYFHNSGAWPYGFDVNYKMWTTLIQVNDPHLKKSSRQWFKGEIGSGSSTFSETIGHQF